MFFFRYVDDIAMAVHYIQLDRLLDIFNSFPPWDSIYNGNWRQKINFPWH